MRAVLLLAAVLAAGAVGLAACGGDDDEPSVTAFCDQIEELDSQSDPLENVGEGDIDGVKDAIGTYQDALDEVAAVAPEEISGDVDQVQQIFNDLADSLEDDETPQDLIATAQQFQGEAADLQSTGQRLEEYTNENCDTGGDTTG